MTNAGATDVAAVNTRLAELVRKFLARTEAEIAQMRATLAQPDADHGGGLEQIRQLAHRACGTGGTLGLHALADAAGALEQLIETCPADAIPDATTRARIAAAIDALAAQLPSR